MPREHYGFSDDWDRAGEAGAQSLARIRSEQQHDEAMGFEAARFNEELAQHADIKKTRDQEYQIRDYDFLKQKTHDQNAARDKEREDKLSVDLMDQLGQIDWTSPDADQQFYAFNKKNAKLIPLAGVPFQKQYDYVGGKITSSTEHAKAMAEMDKRQGIGIDAANQRQAIALEEQAKKHAEMIAAKDKLLADTGMDHFISKGKAFDYASGLALTDPAKYAAARDSEDRELQELVDKTSDPVMKEKKAAILDHLRKITEHNDLEKQLNAGDKKVINRLNELKAKLGFEPINGEKPVSKVSEKEAPKPVSTPVPKVFEKEASKQVATPQPRVRNKKTGQEGYIINGEFIPIPAS